VLLGVVDEVPHDEEVAAEGHLDDDVHLAQQALAILIGIELLAAAVLLGEAALETVAGDLAEVAVEVVALGHLVLGQVGLAEVELDVAALGDLDGVLERLGHVAELGVELLGRLDVVGGRAVLETTRVVERLALLDAHQDVVRLPVGLLHVVAVAGGDEAEPGLARHLLPRVVDLLLLVEAVGLHLEEERVVLEQRLVLERLVLGVLVALAHQRLRHLAAQARRQADEPLGVILEQLLVDARVVVEALEERLGVEELQVLVALLVLRQEDEVVVLALGLVLHRGRRDVGLAAEDRLDPGVLGLLVEVDHAVHVAVVGEGHRVHAHLLTGLEQVGQPDGPVEQAVLGMQVEVRELGHAAI
jgi:hypothetical protein